MPHSIDAVVFDLDGTLLNTLDDLCDSLNAALTRSGFPTRTLAEVRRFVGNGSRVLVERAIFPDTAPESIDRVLEHFYPHYARNMRNRTRPYPEIVPLLDALLARDIALAVVSNKFDAAVEPLVRSYFGSRIAVAIGEGEDVPKKPAPQGTRKALAALGVDPSRALYVGDSDVDMHTAHNADLFAVGCTWGFRDRATLTAAGADALIDTPAQLLSLLDAREQVSDHFSLPPFLTI